MGFEPVNFRIPAGYSQSTFHSTKILVCIYGNFQWQMEQHFSEFPEKRATALGSIMKCSEISLPGIFFQFDLLP